MNDTGIAGLLLYALFLYAMYMLYREFLRSQEREQVIIAPPAADSKKED